MLPILPLLMSLRMVLMLVLLLSLGRDKLLLLGSRGKDKALMLLLLLLLTMHPSTMKVSKSSLNNHAKTEHFLTTLSPQPFAALHPLLLQHRHGLCNRWDTSTSEEVGAGH